MHVLFGVKLKTQVVRIFSVQIPKHKLQSDELVSHATDSFATQQMKGARDNCEHYRRNSWPFLSPGSAPLCCARDEVFVQLVWRL